MEIPIRKMDFEFPEVDVAAVIGEGDAEVGMLAFSLLLLFSWHLVEELEHRTVTFDVYDHVVGSYPYRLAVGTWAQYHFLSWVARVVAYITRTQRGREDGGSAPKRRATAEDRKRRMARLRALARRAGRTYLPSYSPHHIEFTPEMQAIADHYSALAVSVR